MIPRLLTAIGVCTTLLTLSSCTTTSTSLIAYDTIDGWESLNDGKWTVTNGELYGTKDAAIAKHSLLVSKQSFTNFEARLRLGSTRHLVKRYGSYLYVNIDPVQQRATNFA